MVRALLMEGAELGDLWQELGLLAGVLVLLVTASVFLLKRAERHMKRTGSMVLY
jgi:ABC-2 type transport system permease protein